MKPSLQQRQLEVRIARLSREIERLESIKAGLRRTIEALEGIRDDRVILQGL